LLAGGDIDYERGVLGFQRWREITVMRRDEINMMRIAMVGAGGYAFEIIKRLWALPEQYELIAVSSLPGYKAAGLDACIRRGIPVYYDHEEMLEALKGQVEMIFVPTSIHSHYEIAKRCVEKGFHVYVEKPPVAVIQDYDDLVQALARQGRRGAIGFQRLYSPVAQRIKHSICRQEYGAVKRIRSSGAWIRYDSYYDITDWGGKIRTDGKWVLDGSISNPLAHMLANSLYFAGTESLSMAVPRSVQAEFYSAHDIDGEDTSSLRIITDNGVEVVSNATLCPCSNSEVITVVECEYADVVLADFCRCRVLWKNGEIEEFSDDEREHQTYMLKSIAESMNCQSEFKADFANFRAFTLAVNCAYESAGGVRRMDPAYFKCQPFRDTVKRVIGGIDEDIRVAHEQGLLFSECGLPWAQSTEPFDCEEYKHFPQSGALVKWLEEEKEEYLV
jgi:predicted dehydrogenase